MARTSAMWPMAGLLSGVLMLATAAGPAEAHWGRGASPRLEEQLGLSDDQVRAIHQARERQWEARRQLARSLGTARESLRGLILSGAEDASVQAKTAEVQQLMGQVLQLRVQALSDLARILTPEQRARLVQHRRAPRSPTADLAPAG